MTPLGILDGLNVNTLLIILTIVGAVAALVENMYGADGADSPYVLLAVMHKLYVAPSEIEYNVMGVLLDLPEPNKTLSEYT